MSSPVELSYIFCEVFLESTFLFLRTSKLLGAYGSKTCLDDVPCDNDEAKPKFCVATNTGEQTCSSLQTSWCTLPSGRFPSEHYCSADEAGLCLTVAKNPVIRFEWQSASNAKCPARKLPSIYQRRLFKRCFLLLGVWNTVKIQGKTHPTRVSVPGREKRHKNPIMSNIAYRAVRQWWTRKGTGDQRIAVSSARKQMMQWIIIAPRKIFCLGIKCAHDWKDSRFPEGVRNQRVDAHDERKRWVPVPCGNSIQDM